jgi:hypothetical protein
MRTPEQKLATKLRKAIERKAHHERVFRKHPPSVRYAKAKFKTGRKQPKQRRLKIQLGKQ